MTDMGYQNIIDRIRTKPIEPPSNMTANELQAWLTGYLQAQRSVIGVIEELKKGAGYRE